jgi:hypothetical protein
MKKILLLVMMTTALTVNAQSLETSSNYPTGYITASYYSSSNTIKSIDGVLYMIYDDVPVALVKYPAMNEREEFEVPATVYRICNNAFQGTRYLKTLKLHNTVTFGNFITLVIGESAFNDSSIENFVVIENDGTTVGINGHMPAPSANEVGRYDVAGRPVSPSANGVQIITYDDHSSKKVVKK